MMMLEEMQKKFTMFPGDKYIHEIRTLLGEEIASHPEDGCTDELRFLCYLLFYIGKVEDCEIIWKAKSISMDTSIMIDVGLLFGAGYEATMEYIEDKPHMAGMRYYMEEYNATVDEPIVRDETLHLFLIYFGM
ncbi:hypothetical protein LJC42_01070 [Eubacteriales bacterium OttesenSCG-928-K08]|nr:hypothetical protein [Eubacteriales bacterium OttesenSCG-928-K08]